MIHAKHPHKRAFYAVYRDIALIAHVSGITVRIAEWKRSYYRIPLCAPKIIVAYAFSRINLVQLGYARFEGYSLLNVYIPLVESAQAVHQRARAHHAEPESRVIDGAYAVRDMLVFESDTARFKLLYYALKHGELLFVLFLVYKSKMREYALNIYVRRLAYGKKLFYVIRAEPVEAGIDLKMHLCFCAKSCGCI